MTTQTQMEPVDLRVDIRILLAALILISVLLVFLEQPGPTPLDGSGPNPARFTSIILLIVSLVIATLVAKRYVTALSDWILLFGLLSIIYIASTWFSEPCLMPCMCLVVILAAAIRSVSSAALIAAVGTIFLLALRWLAVNTISVGTVRVTTLSLWLSVGLATAIYHPIRTIAHVSQRYFQDAQISLTEARSYQGELRQALDDLQHLNRQLMLTTQMLDEAKGEAEEARKLKADFVARVSHELRTPINMIVGFSEMIVDAPEVYASPLPPPLVADLDVIRRNGQHLSSLIDDVLDLGQIDVGRMALTKERVPLADIVEAATIAVRPLYQFKGLFLQIDVAPALPLVFCDPTRIRETLVNLLSNAGRFTEEGGVTLSVWREDNQMITSVADTGPGIEPEAGKRLFRPFEQLDGSIRRRYGGTGLGLTISKTFVEAHGGRMWFESEVDRGTTFFFSLPIDPPRPVHETALRWLEPTWEYRQRLTRPSLPESANMCRRLMVVERKDALARLIERYVDDVELIRCENLEEAAHSLAHEPVQALLVNGTSVSQSLEIVNASATTRYRVPTIVSAIPDSLDRIQELGAIDYMVKPVSRERLLGLLDQYGDEISNILIVDDEPDALQLFRRMLISSGRGYHVACASDGQEAISILQESLPDILLVDLVMANMDGFHLLEALKKDPRTADIPIVIISALDPTGQPIVSSSLAVTMGGGFSVPQFLTCVEGLTTILQPARAKH